MTAPKALTRSAIGQYNGNKPIEGEPTRNDLEKGYSVVHTTTHQAVAR